MTTASTQHEQALGAAGSMLAEVSRRLVQLHKEAYGRGPTKARSFASGDVLVCVLEGGFLPMERTLEAHGRGDVVEEQREAMRQVMHDPFVQAIEDITGRRVMSVMSAADQARELSTEIFVFEPREELGLPEFA